MSSPRDPFRYFRIEARELLDAIGEALMALERAPDAGRVQDLLRHAHTLKGAARVVRQSEIARLAHEIEDVFSGHPDGTVGQGEIGRPLALLESMREHLGRLDAPPPDAGTHAPEPLRAAKSAAARIDLATTDDLLERVRRAAVSCARGRALTRDAVALLRRAGDSLERLRQKATVSTVDTLDFSALDEDLDRMLATLRLVDVELDENGREGAGLRDAISEIRLGSMHGLAQELEQLARASAGTLGKSVRVEVVGADTRIDAGVLVGLRTALRHLVQNAIAHGIESESQRVAAQKDPLGRISLSFEAHGHRVHAICTDDGAGIDEAAVRKVVEDRGIRVPATLDRADLFDLLFTRGFTTAQRVDEIAGRGIGLDIVATTIGDLNGEVLFDSSYARGTTVRLIVPISLVSTQALALEIAGRGFFVPLDNVATVLPLDPRSHTITPEGERIVVDGESIPFLPGSRLLAPGNSAGGSPRGTAVVLHAGRRRAAIGVTRVRGVQAIVTYGLPERFAVAPFVAGAGISDVGAPELVLAALPTIEAVTRSVQEVVVPSTPERPPILVVDDSLTTRMLEKSILESAGYDVDVAVSAEQAIEMARRRRYGLLLVDVEMPGMDGFGLVSFMRDDPEFQGIPAILVTSRSDDDDKRRGKASGARAYIVKSEFDQKALLDTIGSLIA